MVAKGWDGHPLPRLEEGEVGAVGGYGEGLVVRLSDLPVRTVLKCNIRGRDEDSARREIPLDPSAVRYIRRISARASRWIAWLDKHYSVDLARAKKCSWKNYKRKQVLRRKILDRYGKAALARQFELSERAIYDLVGRKTYRGIE